MGVLAYTSIILLFGATLSTLMSLYLWFYPHQSFSNRILAALMFIWSFAVFIFAVQSMTFYSKHPHLFGIASQFMFLFFPLVFIFVKSYLHEEKRKLKHYLLHFIPFFIFLLVLTPFYLKSGALKRSMLEDGFPDWFYKASSVGDITVIVQGVLYSILSIRTIQHFQYFSKKRLSKNQLQSIRWLWQFVVINVVLWALGTTGVVLESMQVKLPFNAFFLLYIGVILLTLRMGYFAIRYPSYFILQSAKSPLTDLNTKRKEVPKNKEDLNRIMDFFKTEKPFLSKDLNMQLVSDRLDIPKHRVSELINTELEKSFSDFVNEFRVEEVIRLINEGKHIESTLSYVGEEAGFNSKANFFRIFKKVTGMTPNEYIKSKEL